MLFQNERSINYYLRKLQLVEINYITDDKKMLAIIIVLKY